MWSQRHARPRGPSLRCENATATATTHPGTGSDRRDSSAARPGTVNSRQRAAVDPRGTCDEKWQPGAGRGRLSHPSCAAIRFP